ncbi:alpha/beta fold hydrolase [Ilumatobacter coccineus]|jgi:pimeloyl-ACP methyl ester carboxylesterase|uniref:Putative hydrolase n=1 Tax=Ilumatobacter coccineus (strain NBRC 103263 / KCTC 29153 / YM16-304) TaxID=1313172 RepID=A0A6C7EAR7_ILUCY|nr:alpha/beta hydrolase [Ilumatobacter coccineus]BAN03423.1 putative hydrolase [Ilumatobacter coccineus YM16-304]
MQLFLTVVVVLLTVAITALIVWEIMQRRSPLVKVWNPSSFPGRVTGGLGMLEGGAPSDRLHPDDPEVVVVLHGLGATADYFGDIYEGIAIDHRLVMPDLLGFGRSLDELRTDFGLDAHVDAIDGVLESLGAGRSRVLIAAHSMGSAVALAWAKRHPDRATGVVLWGPPVYESADAAQQIADEAGGMTKLLVADNEWSRRLCRLNCEHRRVAGWLMAAASPRWPTDVSRRASLHTWEAFDGSLHELVLDADWRELFAIDTPVTVFRGADDPIGDRAHLTAVARRATIVDVDGAGHHVALTHPHLLFDLLER